MADTRSNLDSESSSDDVHTPTSVVNYADGVPPDEDDDPDMLTEDQLQEGIARLVRDRLMTQNPDVPVIAFEISGELYAKAEKQQDELTHDERQILLSRGDLIGKALAQPESLTPEEFNTVLCRPPPDVVRATIERVTGGALHTRRELMAKMNDLRKQGRLDEVKDDELALIMNNFSANVYDSGMPDFLNQAPGNGEAFKLLSRREQEEEEGSAATATALMLLWFMGAAIRVQARAEALRAAARQQPAMAMGSPLPPRLPGLLSASQRTQSPLARPPWGLGTGGMGRRSSPQVDEDHFEELDVIVNKMEEIQTQRDKGELTYERFMEENWKHVASIREYSRKKRRILHPRPPSTTPLPPRGPHTNILSHLQPLGFPGTHGPIGSLNIPPVGLVGNPALGSAVFTAPGALSSILSSLSQNPDVGMPTAPSSSTSGAVPSAPPLTSRPEPKVCDRWSTFPGGKVFWPVRGGMPRKLPTTYFSEHLREKMEADGIVVDNYQRYLRERWVALTAEEQAHYQQLSEAARQADWDEFEAEKLLVGPQYPFRDGEAALEAPFFTSMVDFAEKPPLPDYRGRGRWNRDYNGLFCWPSRFPVGKHSGRGIFCDELRDKMTADGTLAGAFAGDYGDYLRYAHRRWDALTDNEQAPYRERSEARRQTAWDEHDEEQRRRASLAEQYQRERQDGSSAKREKKSG